MLGTDDESKIEDIHREFKILKQEVDDINYYILHSNLRKKDYATWCRLNTSFTKQLRVLNSMEQIIKREY